MTGTSVPEVANRALRRGDHVRSADRRRARDVFERRRPDLGGRHQRHRHAAAVKASRLIMSQQLISSLTVVRATAATPSDPALSRCLCAPAGSRLRGGAHLEGDGVSRRQLDDTRRTGWGTSRRSRGTRWCSPRCAPATAEQQLPARYGIRLGDRMAEGHRIQGQPLQAGRRTQCRGQRLRAAEVFCDILLKGTIARRADDHVLDARHDDTAALCRRDPWSIPRDAAKGRARIT